MGFLQDRKIEIRMCNAKFDLMFPPISGSQTSDDILPEKISCRSIKVCRIQRCKVKEFRKDGRIVYHRLAGETSPKPKDCLHNFVLWTDHYGNGNKLDTKC